MSTPINNQQPTGKYATKVKQLQVGENIDELFDKEGRSLYTLVFIDQDKVTDRDDMLLYCLAITEHCQQLKQNIPPMILVYYSTGIDWRNFTETVMLYQEFGVFTCMEKEGDALIDLDAAVKKDWADRDAQREAHMRSLYSPVAEQEGEWSGRLTLNDYSQNIFNFTASGVGEFVLRGGDPEKYIGRPMHSLKVRGKILSERADAHLVENLLQILEVQEIIGNPVSDEEIQRNIEEYSKGPFLGRLNHPEIFGENPDLYGPMTPEQWDRMTNPEKYGYERTD